MELLNKSEQVFKMELIPKLGEEFLDPNLPISSEIYLTTTEPLNIINLSENQIVKIEYQNVSVSDLINGEYVLSDPLISSPSIIDDTAQQMKDDVDDKTLPLSPETDEEQRTETDLTSLNWLHNITNIMQVPNIPTPPISPPLAGQQAVNVKRTAAKNVPNAQEDLTININYYKRNGDKKPPFSYATLICLAMSKNGNKMTLSAIYNWIRGNFLYYKKAHPSWQNSIRHNLSLNKCFVKVARSKDEPGKGGFWRLDLERLEESRRSKRRSSLTVRLPRARLHQTTTTSSSTKQPSKPIRKRYRPQNQTTNERKHNILSNISICGSSESDSPNDEDGDEEEEEEMEEEEKSILLEVKSEDVKLVPTSMPNQNVIIEPANQGMLPEDELAGLLLASVGWDDCQLEMLDSLLDSL